MDESPNNMQRPNDRTGPLVVGGVLILLGLLFLCSTIANTFLGFNFGLWRLWPVIFLVASGAFYIPIIANWPRRAGMAGLAIPGTIFLGLFAIFAYSTWTDNWGAWSWMWAVIPLSVGVGMYLAYFLGERNPGLFTGATIVSGISLVMLVMMGVFAGGRIIAIVGPLLLIAAGVAFIAWTLLGGANRRA